MFSLTRLILAKLSSVDDNFPPEHSHGDARMPDIYLHIKVPYRPFVLRTIRDDFWSLLVNFFSYYWYVSYYDAKMTYFYLKIHFYSVNGLYSRKFS